MSAHTSPAPWRIGQPAPDIQARATVRDAHGWDVAHCFGEDTAEANARLIAAAPDLLAAAKEVLADLNARIEVASASGTIVPVFAGIAALHTAVALAEGRDV